MFHRLLTALCLLSLTTYAQKAKKEKAPPPPLNDATVRHEVQLYKTTPQGELQIHFAFPQDWKATDKRPAIVFFFGGGWTSGSHRQFTAEADYFASRGLVAASADYRIASIHKTKPDKCVEDAKSAVRYLRGNAAKLGIDPDRIIAAGGSAGGHLAACTATIEDFNADTDDKSISAKPNALVLYNPALNIDELAAARGQADRIAEAEKITPNRFLTKASPPAILFFGTDDRLIEGAHQYMEKAKALGLSAELWTAKDQPHGFFNRSPWAEVCVKRADQFLTSLGYLTGEPSVKMPADAPALAKE